MSPWLILGIAIPVIIIALVILWPRRKRRLPKQLSLGLLEDAMGRAEQQDGSLADAMWKAQQQDRDEDGRAS